MIFGNIKNLSEYPFLEKGVQECFEYLNAHDILSYEKGSHEIDGDKQRAADIIDSIFDRLLDSGTH